MFGLLSVVITDNNKEEIMLSKIIVSSYALFIEVSLWLSMLMFAVGGWSYSNPITGEGGGFLGAVTGLIVWFIVAVIILGAFLVLNDIRKSVQKIEKSRQT